MLGRGNKLIVPITLRFRILELAHQGHPGASVMKQRSRKRVWRPGMPEVRTNGRMFTTFEAMGRRSFRLLMSCGTHLLVAIGYFSRYKKIEIMNRIPSKETVGRLGKIRTR